MKKIDIDIDNLPESFRNDYVKLVYFYYIIENTQDFDSSKYRIYHKTILQSLLDTEISKIVKESAVKNPLEFMRYHKVISDSVFAIVFGQEIKDNRKIIDLLEELLLCEDGTSYYYYVNIIKSVTYKNLRSNHVII